MENDVRTEEVIERFCACDYCGTKVKIGPAEPADTLCPTCGAKRHEVIEKHIVNHPASVQQPQTPVAPTKCKWVWNFQQAGKVLLFLLVLLIITLIVYKIRGIW